MQSYSQFKVSPTTGERIYSSTEIANDFGISAQLLNKFLEKIGIFKKTNDIHRPYVFADKSLEGLLGEECYFNSSKFEYNSKDENIDEKSNVTIKFSKLGREYIEKILTQDYKLSCRLDEKFKKVDLEDAFPKGRFALSVRLAGTRYNPDPHAHTKIFLSYRDNRNDSEFSRYYMYIDDISADAIKKDIKEWAKQKKSDKCYMIEVDGNETASKILLWKDKYFTEILKNQKHSLLLTADEKAKNKEILTLAINA